MERIDLSNIAGLFDLRADFIHAYPYGSGHINDTYCAEYEQAGHRLRYIHQRINQNVFRDPVCLMENIHRVTIHNQNALARANHPERTRRGLTLIPAVDGKPYATDDQGNYWRTYPFIERARTYDKIESSEQARAASAAFGSFQKLAATLPGDRLNETIPDFHHTPRRYDAFCRALEQDPLNRAADVKGEIDFLQAHEKDYGLVVGLMETDEIPERITHNDTKLNNVMLDDITGEGVCVIDLDTVMPGCVLYDFGDMVRTATSSGAEDDKNFGEITMQMPMFEALVEGYLEGARDFLTKNEVELLAFSGKLLALENGIRFLTDYLLGDPYFKTKYPNHNLDRNRTQMTLVQSIEKQLTAMENVVKRNHG